MKKENDLIMERKKYLCHICVCDCSCFHIYMRSRMQNLILTFVCVFFPCCSVSLQIILYNLVFRSFPRIPRDRKEFVLMEDSFCVHRLDNLSKSANFIINFQLLLFFLPLDGMDKLYPSFVTKRIG